MKIWLAGLFPWPQYAVGFFFGAQGGWLLAGHGSWETMAAGYGIVLLHAFGVFAVLGERVERWLDAPTARETHEWIE